MIPTVVFKYSKLYDDILKRLNVGRRRTQILSPSAILKYLDKINYLWRKNENEVLSELSRISHLKWEEKIIYCYVVGSSIPFSDPITIPAYKEQYDYFIDILIHELIHRLFSEPINYEKMKKVWKYFYRKYKTEATVTQNHIPLHALYIHIMLKFFNYKRLKREIKLISYLPPYKRSWEIVLKDDHKNIIKELRHLTE